jgi:hypothetical protein
MTEKENISNELNALSPFLAATPIVNAYKVDANYFDGIRAELQARIIADSFSTTIQEKTVPASYFENLPASILQKIKATENNEILTELETISPVIANISNENVYEIPHGYFDNIRFTEKSRVVGINHTRAFFKYAAAAVIISVISLGIFKYSNSSLTDNASTASPTVIKQADDILKKDSFDKELETLSDKDLEKYLSQTGDDVNAGLVASTIYNDALPDTDDYLFDDNTLDNFLNTNNLKN